MVLKTSLVRLWIIVHRNYSKKYLQSLRNCRWSISTEELQGESHFEEYLKEMWTRLGRVKINIDCRNFESGGNSMRVWQEQRFRMVMFIISFTSKTRARKKGEKLDYMIKFFVLRLHKLHQTVRHTKSFPLSTQISEINLRVAFILFFILFYLFY